MQADGGGEPKNMAAPCRKVTLPEPFDDWDDFDLSLSSTKNKPKLNEGPITRPTVTHAALVAARKKSLFDDDDDDVDDTL